MSLFRLGVYGAAGAGGVASWAVTSEESVNPDWYNVTFNDPGCSITVDSLRVTIITESSAGLGWSSTKPLILSYDLATGANEYEKMYTKTTDDDSINLGTNALGSPKFITPKPGAPGTVYISGVLNNHPGTTDSTAFAEIDEDGAMVRSVGITSSGFYPTKIEALPNGDVIANCDTTSFDHIAILDESAATPFTSTFSLEPDDQSTTTYVSALSNGDFVASGYSDHLGDDKPTLCVIDSDYSTVNSICRIRDFTDNADAGHCGTTTVDSSDNIYVTWKQDDDSAGTIYVYVSKFSGGAVSAASHVWTQRIMAHSFDAFVKFRPQGVYSIAVSPDEASVYLCVMLDSSAGCHIIKMDASDGSEEGEWSVAGVSDTQIYSPQIISNSDSIIIGATFYREDPIWAYVGVHVLCATPAIFEAGGTLGEVVVAATTAFSLTDRSGNVTVTDLATTTTSSSPSAATRSDVAMTAFGDAFDHTVTAL